MVRWFEAAVSAVLKHPVVIRVKAVVRDVTWRIAPPAVGNPPLPERVDAVIFVCLGNICRSPFAGLLAERRLTETPGMQTVARSAGIKTTQSARSPREAVDAAAPYGVSLELHRPVTLSAELMAAHDLVVVMEAAQMEQLRRTYPQWAERIVLLPLFDPDASGYARYHIDDPFMQPPEAFAACYRRIDRAVTSLCRSLGGRMTPAGLKEHQC